MNKLKTVVLIALGIPILSAGCSDPSAGPSWLAPAAGEPPVGLPPVGSLPVPPPFPSVPSDALVFTEGEPIYSAYSAFHGAIVSRYVFLADSAFSLQFASYRFGIFEYTGTFSRSDPFIAFRFGAGGGWGGMIPWDARGVMRGDRLDVAYNEIMRHSDFVNGVYVRGR